MLSYQHSYHAGGPADVHKHAALSLLLSAIKRTHTQPVTYLETHAGRGQYHLLCKEAKKTKEAEAGILGLSFSRILQAAPDYAASLTSHRNHFGQESYPGSPAIARAILGRKDRLQLMELHPQEFKALTFHFRAPNIDLYRHDGYEKALELARHMKNQAFLLIDPSYEIKQEYTLVTAFIHQLHLLCPKAIILLWYPILESGLHHPMIQQLEASHYPQSWRQETLFQLRKHRALGSGLFGINIPSQLAPELEKIRPLI